MDLDVLELLVRRSLEHGVPADITAAVFDLPGDIVREMLREVRVVQFGTSDRAEYLEHLQWTALHRAEDTIKHGTPQEAARIATAVLGRQIAASGKRPSEGLAGAREEIMGALANMRDGEAAPVSAGRFVVGNTDAGRRAEVDDDEDE